MPETNEIPNPSGRESEEKGSEDFSSFSDLPSSPASVGDEATMLHEPDGSAMVDGRLKLLEKLGEGGMGVVWKARDAQLGRFVALKRPKGAMLNLPRGRARFMREAQACARLSHPHIITVYHVGEDAQGPFIEMEYVEGFSLREEVRRCDGKLDERRVREIGMQLCEALALAHSHAITHRDIKPANILLTARGAPKLGDFGLAAAKEESGEQVSMTATGAMLGTMYYASPEQLRDAKDVDQRSDIYSLGATLYFTLTGEDPQALRFERLPAALRPVLQKALEPKPEDRFPDMSAFEQALRDAQAGAAEGLCPRCSAVNAPTARHCVRCGASLAELFQRCPKCKVENRSDQKYCHGCGANLRQLAEIGQIREDLKRAIEGRLYEEMARLGERGLELAPGDIFFTAAAKDGKEALESLRQLRAQLALIAPGEINTRIEILGRILNLAPGDEAVHEAWEAAQRDKERLEAQLARLLADLRRAEEAHSWEDMERLAQRGVEVAPTQPAFSRALKSAQTALESLRQLREQLAQTPLERPDLRIPILEQILNRAPQDEPVREQLRAARAESELHEAKKRETARIRMIQELKNRIDGLAAEEMDERISLLDRLIELQPGDAEAAKAREAAKEAKRSRDVKRLHREAKQHYEQRRFDEAFNAMRQAVALAPESESLRRAMVRVEEARDKFNQRRNDWRASLEARLGRGEYAGVLEDIARSPFAQAPEAAALAREAEQKLDLLRSLLNRIPRLRERRAYMELRSTLERIDQLHAHLPEREPLDAECRNALQQNDECRNQAERAYAQGRFSKALAHCRRGQDVCSDDPALADLASRAVRAAQRRRFGRAAVFSAAAAAGLAAAVGITMWLHGPTGNTGDSRRTAPPAGGAHPEAIGTPPARPTVVPARGEPSAENPQRDNARAEADNSLPEMVWIPLEASPAQGAPGQKDAASAGGPPQGGSSSGFWMGKTEVTQAQYEAIMGFNPSKLRDPNNPVECVKYADAMEFSRRLSQKTGCLYTLPTEAQWEHACRGGGAGTWCFGDNREKLNDYAWHAANSGQMPHPVAAKRPNAWGLYDMHGNVREWCLDSSGAEGSRASPVGSPQGTSSSVSAVLRGGSWEGVASDTGTMVRYRLGSSPPNATIGFRVCRLPQAAPAPELTPKG